MKRKIVEEFNDHSWSIKHTKRVTDKSRKGIYFGPRFWSFHGL